MMRVTEGHRKARGFEDRLSSGSEAEESGTKKPPGAKMLRELLKGLPPMAGLEEHPKLFSVLGKNRVVGVRPGTTERSGWT